MEFVKVFSQNYLNTSTGKKYYFKEVSSDGETVSYGSTYNAIGLVTCYYEQHHKVKHIICKSKSDAQLYLNYTSGSEILTAEFGSPYPEFREIMFEGPNLEETYYLLHAYTDPGTELYINPYFRRCLLLLPRDPGVLHSVEFILISSNAKYKFSRQQGVFMVSDYKHTLLYTLCNLFQTEILKKRED